MTNFNYTNSLKPIYPSDAMSKLCEDMYSISATMNNARGTLMFQKSRNHLKILGANWTE
jgi:hypothetical protein